MHVNCSLTARISECGRPPVKQSLTAKCILKRRPHRRPGPSVRVDDRECREIKKMFTRNKLRLLTTFGLGLSLLLTASVLVAQKDKKKKKDPKPLPAEATAGLWQEPP